MRKKLFQDFTSFAVFLIGLTSGVVQLAGPSTGFGRILLAVVCIVCFLYLIVRYTHFFLVRRNEQMRQELTAQQVAHQSYVEAINKIIDQEGPIYAENLELTVVIGTDDAGDTIVERRQTKPQPRVTQRAIRPIVPVGSDGIVGLDDIGLRCTLEKISGTITPRPLAHSGKPRVWLVFEPGLTETFTWQISYCSPGLWAPLRKQGSDLLIWNDRLPAGNGATSVLNELSVRFVFPASEKAPTVHERHGFGQVQAAVPREGGWLVVYTDPAPAGRRYEWDLAQAP